MTSVIIFAGLVALYFILAKVAVVRFLRVFELKSEMCLARKVYAITMLALFWPIIAVLFWRDIVEEIN